jgi:hypothetical protein
MVTAEQLRKEASQCDKFIQDSFDRCDTDGFLSQYASGITSQEKRKQAEILDNGGWYEFRALFNLKGERVKAKLESIRNKFSYQYESVWALYDNNGRFLKYITAFPKCHTTMLNKGYREGFELADAEAFVDGRGFGLSGTAWVAVKRLDWGYPVDAVGCTL